MTLGAGGWIAQEAAAFQQRTGRALVATHVNSGGQAESAAYSVDLERIPGLIEKYEQARDKLREIDTKAGDLVQLGEAGAPGNDEVSRRTARDFAAKADDDPGALWWAIRDGIERLTEQIEQLKAAKRGYEVSEEQATPRGVEL
ncbi:hypothetical protein SAMN04487905_111184 [Actinopolyspora xinjiangensis]|uniref:PE family protein n=1 Tax=Actinopolyspora xinjiangensis TaxID=405564 RepID=A0A1H0WC80_9ACTN|nr:hypothetical protein [Actinopolyspora xinjiangensis]SDP88314.1 hypothetical protein SAMN04487905_111184 [Actinopolyspora xinjiangensis]